MIRQTAAKILVATFLIVMSPHEQAASAEAATLDLESSTLFRDTVMSIDAEGDFSLAQVFLLGIPKFIELSNSASPFVDSCIALLSQPGLSHQQREIAILSMAKLDPDHYVDFVNKVTRLFERQLVSYFEFEDAIEPIYDFSPTAIDNFTNPKIRSLLEKIRSRGDIDDKERAAIDAVLSGESYAGISDFREISGIAKNRR